MGRWEQCCSQPYCSTCVQSTGEKGIQLPIRSHSKPQERTPTTQVCQTALTSVIGIFLFGSQSGAQCAQRWNWLTQLRVNSGRFPTNAWGRTPTLSVWRTIFLHSWETQMPWIWIRLFFAFGTWRFFHICPFWAHIRVRRSKNLHFQSSQDPEEI